MQATVRQRITAGLILPLITIFLLTAVISPVHAETSSDFTSDVQIGLTAAVRTDLQSAILDVKAEDYQSSWDEFGTNILADGSHLSEDIQKELTDDIVNDLRTHLAYDQKDAQYLQLIHSSPEEVIVAEGDGGNDLSPDNYVDPNPSLEANPSANPSVLDMPTSAIDTIDVSTVPDTTTPENTLTSPDTLVPVEGTWKPDDITVFENVLNADAPVTTPIEPNPDVAPPTDQPSSEASTN